MTHEGTSTEAAHAAIKLLVAEKLRYLVPMTIVFVTSYVGLTAFAGFAKSVVGAKVIGPINLGYVLIAFNYLLSWLLAVLYGVVAKSKFDPLASRSALDFSREVTK